MPVFNKGTSTYHTVQGLYWRDVNGTLLAVEGINSGTLPELWQDVWAEIRSDDAAWTRTQLPSGKQINSLRIKATHPALEQIRSNFPPSREGEFLVTKVAEIEHADGLVLGMLSSRPMSLADDAFGTWAENFILSETEFQPFAQLSPESAPEHRRIAEQVADIFEKKLKNVSKDDQWNVCGREKFLNRVYGYVEKNQPILFALPAFPCKSPNSKKTGGIMPDLAENIALDVLRDFVKELTKVYSPGATLWVINDGHVFSDCIGADDSLIDTFDARMAELYNEKYVEEGPVPAIRFKGLKNIFLENPATLGSFEESWLASAEMPHPVETERTSEAELCRKLMLGVGEADRAYIRQCIEEQEPYALNLYRGQTRFMLEDLAEVPSVKKLSNKQKKKTAANVAQEMMSRNQAYSNLVELLLPNYVRLSIHAHPNKGPKFAVRLLPKTMVRAIESLESRHETNPAYEFQLPTPWHNSIIKVQGDDLLYLARAEVAQLAVAGPDFDGSWVDGPNGAYYSLRWTGTPEVEEPAPVVEEKKKSPLAPLRISTAVSTKKPEDEIFSPAHRALRRINTEILSAKEEPEHAFEFVAPAAAAAALSILSPVIDMKPLAKSNMSKAAPADSSFRVSTFLGSLWRYVRTGA